MSPTRRDSARAATALVLSAATHLSLTLLGLPAPAGGDEPERAEETSLVDVELELPEVAHHPRSARGEASEPEVARGGERMPRPDGDRAGRGGSLESQAPAVNLAPRDDEAHLSPELRSRLERAQEARTKSGDGRRSPEDDRVSPHPMILTFVADGVGSEAQLQRARASSSFDGESARPASLPPLTGGGVRLAATPPLPGEGDAERERELERQTGLVGAPARETAAARPLTVVGGESSPSNLRGKQQDDVDAEQEVSAVDASLLRASTAGGAEGARLGGSEGQGAPGAGGSAGPGSRAQPLGSGAGSGSWIDPADARRRRYLRLLAMRIHRSWSPHDFPKQAILEGRQGHTIVRFTVLGDGRVINVQVSRSSGYPDFDRKMVLAVQRAAPFGPLPRELGPVLQRSHDFVVSNPAVRPPHR
jgi:TonB family protein